MNKMIIAVFNTEENAYKGLTALKKLHKSKDLNLFASAIINKEENGELVVKQLSQKGPIGIAVGTLSGALIGFTGGAVSMAAGAFAGMLGGMFYDLDDGKVNATFLEEVAEALIEGKTAVIADVKECNVAPVNERLEKLNAQIFRRRKSEVAEDQFNRELNELNVDLIELEKAFDIASFEIKESIQEKIDAIIEKKEIFSSIIEFRINKLKEETKKKNEVLDTLIKNAKEQRRSKILKQKNTLKESFNKQNEKLVAASVKASEYYL